MITLINLLLRVFGIRLRKLTERERFYDEMYAALNALYASKL